LAASTVAAERSSGPQDASALNTIERGGGLRAPAPQASFLRRITGGLAGLVLGALTLTGCKFEPGGLEPRLDAGFMPDAVTDAMDAPDAGPLAGPMPVFPADTEILPPTLAYHYWRDGDTPSGRTIAGYELCRTSGPVTEIDEDSECPNLVQTTQNLWVLDPLSSLANYHWKVRTRFDDDSRSVWSAVQAFSTDDSLVAWWRLNGDALDSGPAGLDGTTQNGAGFAAGLEGQALSADGTNDYIDMGSDNALHLNGPLTVSAWINGNGAPTAADTGILNVGSLNYALTHHTNGRVYFYIGNGGNNLNAAAGPGAWHQVTGTFDGTTNADGMKFYLNGAVAGMRASTVATTGATGSLWIGRYNMSYFRGLIDSVAVYNKALSGAEVLNEHCAVQALAGTNPLPPACTP
jgi:hypothetical protein